MASKQYDTLSQAVNDLNKRGFTHSFDYQDNGLKSSVSKVHYKKNELHIVETYRFEGATNPDDSSVVYAIEANDGAKGLLIDAYGAYADGDKSAFIIGISKEQNI